MEDKNKPWYNFMSSNEWAVAMNILRILTFIGIFILIFIMYNNIEQVKLLASDPCKICMNKTGATCFKLGLS